MLFTSKAKYVHHRVRQKLGYICSQLPLAMLQVKMLGFLLSIRFTSEVIAHFNGIIILFSDTRQPYHSHLLTFHYQTHICHKSI